jgi:hypothetical protein
MCYDAVMKRTTVTLPDELAALLDRERRRRDVSAATIVREAVAAYLAGPPKPKRYSFIGIGHSGGKENLGREHEEILAREWPDWIAEDSGLTTRAGANQTDPAVGAEETPDQQTA